MVDRIDQNTGPPALQLDLRLESVRYAARHTLVFEWVRPGGGALPAVLPGDHIDVHLPGGLVRQYSLLDSGPALPTWRIAVKLEDASRGGSRSLHALRVGTLTGISGPRSQFVLAEGAPHSVLFAAGIGITPIYAMAARLRAVGRSWELHYICRTQDDAAFAAELSALAPAARLYFTRDGNQGASRPELAAIVAAAPAGSHFYACGPAPLLLDFAAATAGIDPQRVHVERFSAEQAAATAGGYAVECARSGLTLNVGPGQTILQTLRAAGIDVPSSCEEGVCGACETRVLDGTPDHRDAILTPQERAGNQTMMVCCSGASSQRLVLDI